MKQLVLVFDCGATNIRAIAVNQQGDIVHREALPNAPVRQEPGKDWLIWDIDAVWRKLIHCGRKTAAAVGKDAVRAVVVTAFSDDGAPVDRNGNLLYPVISWQCPRTVDIADRIDDYIPSADLFRITGEQVMSQHTLLRLFWLKANAPQALDHAHAYLMTPGIINFRLTGRMTNDPTTADSMMLLDIRRRDYSTSLIQSGRSRPVALFTARGAGDGHRDADSPGRSRARAFYRRAGGCGGPRHPVCDRWLRLPSRRGDTELGYVGGPLRAPDRPRYVGPGACARAQERVRRRRRSFRLRLPVDRIGGVGMGRRRLLWGGKDEKEGIRPDDRRGRAR